MVEKPLVLVIDDSSDSREITSRGLSREFRVVEARTAAEGLDTARRERPDLAIVDGFLPDGDGFALAAGLKDEFPGLPILLLTAMSIEAGGERGEVLVGGERVAFKADAFLSKPVDRTRLLDVARALAGSKAAPPAPLGTVLIVDDDPLILDFLSKVLGESYRAITAATGREGVAKALAERPHVVLLDYRMPDIDGLEVLSRIRSELRECSVIVMTAHGSEKVAVEAMRRGGNDYLAKPFDGEELEAKVREAVHRARLLREHAEDVVRLRDVTRELRDRNRRLEQAEADRARVMSFVLHELRSPVAIVLQGAQGIIEGAVHGDDTRHVVEMIERNARRLLDLTDKLRTEMTQPRKEA